MQVLRAFWLELRAKAPGCGGGAVTMRQLESLIRLAEARARCDLRSLVTRVPAALRSSRRLASLCPASTPALFCTPGSAVLCVAVTLRRCCRRLRTACNPVQLQCHRAWACLAVAAWSLLLLLQDDAHDVVELMQACVWDEHLANCSASNFQRGGAKGKKVHGTAALKVAHIILLIKA